MKKETTTKKKDEGFDMPRVTKDKNVNRKKDVIVTVKQTFGSENISILPSLMSANTV